MYYASWEHISEPAEEIMDLYLAGIAEYATFCGHCLRLGLILLIRAEEYILLKPTI